MKDYGDEREQRALALHEAGKTYEEIAELLGYSTKAAAYNAVKGAKQGPRKARSRIQLASDSGVTYNPQLTTPKTRVRSE